MEFITEEFLSHHGVLGMHWGKRKSELSTDKQPKGFFNKPSAAKAVLLGSFGKKSSFTDAHALKLRKQAGALRIVSVLNTVGGVSLSLLGKQAAARSVQRGSIYVSNAMKAIGAVTAVTSITAGAIAANKEVKARNAP